jgi:hypothetical protein
MFDLELVQQLHALQIDPAASPEEQQEARDKIAALADEVVEQYLATLLSDKGVPKFDCFGELYARNVIEQSYRLGRGLPALELPPEGDIVGHVLAHRRYSACPETE